MDKFEIRRRNLLQLLDNDCRGNMAELARRIDRAPSYVARMLWEEGKEGRKRVGEDLAREIEHCMNLGDGALDAAPRPEGWSDLTRVDAQEYRVLSLFRRFDARGKADALRHLELIASKSS